ncbi:MAG: hypothetical protein QMB39_03390 [Bacteroidales bacterium]|jgi:hypothetical protein
MEGIIISIVIAIVGLFLQNRSEKNKKAARERAARENNTMKPSQIVEEEEEYDELSEYKNAFKDIFGFSTQEPEVVESNEIKEGKVFNNEGQTPLVTNYYQEPVAQERVVEGDIVERSVADINFGDDLSINMEYSYEDGKNDVAEKLHNIDPKMLVLYSEIMKPKFQA